MWKNGPGFYRKVYRRRFLRWSISVLLTSPSSHWVITLPRTQSLIQNLSHWLSLCHKLFRMLKQTKHCLNSTTEPQCLYTLWKNDIHLTKPSMAPKWWLCSGGKNIWEFGNDCSISITYISVHNLTGQEGILNKLKIYFSILEHALKKE